MTSSGNRRSGCSQYLLALAIAFAGCTTPPAQESTRALRFRQFISDGGMDYVHGGGKWYDCLYLPDQGLVCQIVWKIDLIAKPDGALQMQDLVSMYAYHESLEQALAERPERSPESKRAPEQILLPTTFVQRIVELAERTEQQRALSQQLARECVANGFVGDESSVGARDF